MTDRQRKFLYILAAAVAVVLVIVYRQAILPQNVVDMINTVIGVSENDLFLQISQFEGYEPFGVQEPEDRVGVFTFGYGSIYNYDQGRAVELGDPIDRAKAKEYLLREADEKEAAVREMIKVPYTSNQLLALSSFAYQEGITGLKDSTLMEKFNNGDDINSVAAEFDNWVYSKHVFVQGIKNRRIIEKALFLS